MPVAQLDRVLVSEAEGRAFESRQAHLITKGVRIKLISPMTILAIILSFVLGFLAAFIVLKNKNNKLEIENVKLEEKLNSILQNNKEKENYTELIKKEFVNLANQALLEKNKVLDENNQKNLQNCLNPLKEKIKEFQEKVEEYNITGIKSTQSLKEQFEYLANQNKAITTQTEKLSEALSNNSKFRGTFGEMILQRLLKASGLVDKNDDPIKGNYILQEGFKSLDNPEANKVMPDAVIYLAEGNKNIVVDSKASIVNYLEYTNSKDENIAAECIKRFYQNILDRVKELENKYTNLEGLNTPDFTLMFIPFEACMGLIYSNNALIEEANKRNIVIAGPSTLLVALRTVNYTWMQKNQNDNIKDILKTGEGIYNKCLTFIGKMEALATNFDTLRKGFDGVFTSLKGRGGLFSQVEKFRELGFNPAKTIDVKYLNENENPSLMTKE